MEKQSLKAVRRALAEQTDEEKSIKTPQPKLRRQMINKAVLGIRINERPLIHISSAASA